MYFLVFRSSSPNLFSVSMIALIGRLLFLGHQSLMAVLVIAIYPNLYILWSLQIATTALTFPAFIASCSHNYRQSQHFWLTGRCRNSVKTAFINRKSSLPTSCICTLRTVLFPFHFFQRRGTSFNYFSNLIYAADSKFVLNLSFRCLPTCFRISFCPSLFVAADVLRYNNEIPQILQQQWRYKYSF